MAADTFYIRQNGLFFDLHNARTGEVEVELIDCMGEALNYQAQYTAAALEAEQAEAEAAQLSDYMAQQKEMDLIYRQVARLYDADKPATDPRNFAVSEILGAIDSLGRPSAADERRAA